MIYFLAGMIAMLCLELPIVLWVVHRREGALERARLVYRTVEFWLPRIKIGFQFWQPGIKRFHVRWVSVIWLRRSKLIYNQARIELWWDLLKRMRRGERIPRYLWFYPQRPPWARWRPQLPIRSVPLDVTQL